MRLTSTRGANERTTSITRSILLILELCSPRIILSALDYVSAQM